MKLLTIIMRLPKHTFLTSYTNLSYNRGSTQKEVISNLKRENKFLSTEIWQSIWLISRERSVNQFWNWILRPMAWWSPSQNSDPDIIKKGNWAKQYKIYSNFVTVYCRYCTFVNKTKNVKQAISSLAAFLFLNTYNEHISQLRKSL
jgi:hypothetical protein